MVGWASCGASLLLSCSPLPVAAPLNSMQGSSPKLLQPCFFPSYHTPLVEVQLPTTMRMLNVHQGSAFYCSTLALAAAR